MNFGEKFRTEHSNLSGSMSKSELDTYAKKLNQELTRLPLIENTILSLSKIAL